MPGSELDLRRLERTPSKALVFLALQVRAIGG